MDEAERQGGGDFQWTIPARHISEQMVIVPDMPVNGAK